MVAGWNLDLDFEPLLDGAYMSLPPLHLALHKQRHARVLSTGLLLTLGAPLEQEHARAEDGDAE